jgi:ATPase subunit of ABC transporter with duplicated ATPase domains
MSILTVEKLSHSFGGRSIFEDVSFRLLKGEHIGLVGANGEGKSTFMKIIMKTLIPEEGNIAWSKKVKVGYLDQHTILQDENTINDVLKLAYRDLFELEEENLNYYNEMVDCSEEKMNEYLEKIGENQDYLELHDFYLIDSKISEVARAFDLDKMGLDTSVSELSGGQRTRILLAKLLLSKPDILLLDEPTNYLDEHHIRWLKQFLIDYENAFILISHDILFLNDVVNVIYHIEDTVLTRYNGDYQEFIRVYEANQKQLLQRAKKQGAEIAKLEDFVARNKARASTSALATSRAKKLEKIDRIVIKGDKPKPIFSFKYSKTPSKYIFEAEDVVIGYDKDLSVEMNLTLEKGKKIAITGANGLGKSTLIKSLMGDIKLRNGNVNIGDNVDIGYFEQEVTADNDSVIDNLWNEFPSFSQYEVRRELARVGLTREQIESKVRVLSGGEQAKLRLCKLVNREYNVLFLDEPTNHLDQGAKDELHKAIKSYKGTILLVCHESDFYHDIVDEIWDLSNYSSLKA